MTIEFDGQNNKLGTTTADSVTIKTNDTDALTVDSSQRIGIGTSSPSFDLDVNGTILAQDEVFADQYRLLDSGGTFRPVISMDSDDLLIQTGTTTGTRSIFFKTEGTERMRIDSSGFVKHTTTGSYDTYSGADDSHQFVSDNNGHSTLWVTNQNASYSSHAVLRVETNRTPDSGFQFLTTTTGNLTDDQHRLRGDGNAYADGSWNGGGADYAEYFEWADGNTSNEDRVGYSVVLEGNKIRKATDTDNTSNIIGVISGNPFVVGDTSWNKWNEKYLRDDFGRYLKEEYTVTEWEEEIIEEGVTKTIKKSFETDKIPADEIVPNDATIISQETNGENFKRNVLNPNYDETLEYIPREDRKEWSTVGLLGKLRIRKGQPVGDRWIKMKDISDTVEEWLIK